MTDVTTVQNAEYNQQLAKLIGLEVSVAPLFGQAHFIVHRKGQPAGHSSPFYSTSVEKTGDFLRGFADGMGEQINELNEKIVALKGE